MSLPAKIVSVIVILLLFVGLTQLNFSSSDKKDTKSGTAAKAVGTIATDTGNLQTFASALMTADLVDSLNSGGPYTIFAPTDSAFSKLSGGSYAKLVAEENTNQLKRVLRHHIVKRAIKPGQMQDSLWLATAAGDSLLITKRRDSTFVNGAPIKASKISASNGTIYRIGKVLNEDGPKR